VDTYSRTGEVTASSKRFARGVRHELDLNREKQEAQLRDQEAKQSFLRSQREVDFAQQVQIRRRQDEEQREHLGALRGMGVDLTAFLTQARADRVIELRGGEGSTHVHLDSLQTESRADGHPGRGREA